MFFKPIASFIPPPNTHPHGHTATHPYQVPHCSIIQGADARVAINAVAARSKSAWRIPSSTRQQRVSHDAAARGIDPMLPTTAAPPVALAALGLVQLRKRSFGGFRLSPKSSTRWDESSSSRCSRRKREAQSCQPISTAVQQYSLTPTASRKSTRTIKWTRLTIRRRTRRFQSKRAVFDWRNPTV